MQSKTALRRGIPKKDAPLTYCITVRGLVPRSWIDRLGGLRITEASQGRSVLEGPIADPAALAGVLDTLCQLGLPILEVVTLTKAEGSDI